MKKASSMSISLYRHKPKRRRKGIHSKTKQSKNKHSKNYVKVHKSQGVRR